jgi:hypothetical protein
VTHLRKAMLEELQRRNLSPITTRIYLRAVEEFAQYYNKPPDRLGPRSTSESTRLTFSPIRRADQERNSFSDTFDNLV